MIETGVGFPSPLFYIGVVENNVDERLEGRVQVRAFGIHGTNRDIPTEDLPWATLVIGSHDVNFTVPPLNAWVFGFFLDGRSAQQPFVLGLLPTQFTQVNDPSISGWGVALGNTVDVNAQGSRAQDFGQPTLSRLARGEDLEETYLLPLESTRARNIPIAGGGAMLGSSGNMGVAGGDTAPDDMSAGSNVTSPGYPEDMSQAEIESIIRHEASLRGIDPNTAVKIYRSEGAGSYQSLFRPSASSSVTTYNGREASYGPYQLYVGGGLGNDYQQLTGRDLRNDNTRSGITDQIRFALNNAATSGWGAWYGRLNVGVGERDGLSGATTLNNIGQPAGSSTVSPSSTPTASSSQTEGTESTTVSNLKYGQPSWDEPTVAYNAEYPYNRVIETGSGHVIELDDTPGVERIMIYHRNGSYIQMSPSTTTIKTPNDMYSVNEKNYHMYVGGTNVVTIDGDCHILVKGNMVEEVMGDYRQIIHGNHEVAVGGQMNMNGGEQGQIRAANLILESNVENLNIKTGKNIKFESGESIHFKSKDIFMQGTAGVNIKGENMFVEVAAGMNIKSETSAFETSGDFSIKSDHAIIGGGQSVSINASTVAIDDIVHLANGMAGSPSSAAAATDAQSAKPVTRPSPPAKSPPAKSVLI